MDNLKADLADSNDPDERWEADSRVAWTEVCIISSGTRQRVTWPFKHLGGIIGAPSNEIGLRATTLVRNFYRYFKFGYEIAGSNETISCHREV